MSAAPPAAAAATGGAGGRARPPAIPLVSTLQNAPVNLLVLREDGQRLLFDILDDMPGQTFVAMDHTVSGPLKLLVPPPDNNVVLKEHGVGGLVDVIPERPITTACDSVLFIVRPQLHLMARIAEQIRHFNSLPTEKHIAVYFVPKRTFVCERVLQEEGVFANIATIGEYPIDLVPYDDDLLSMEMPSAFRECLLDGDSTSLNYVVQSLQKLQNLYGTFPHIKAKGTLSKIVLDMMMRIRREEDAPPSTTPPEIDTLILLDREVDLVTPMVSPLTYEALIDEIFGIEDSFVKMDKSVFKEGEEKKAAEAERKTRILPLNSNDQLYAEIRDLNVLAVSTVLGERSRTLQATYAGRSTTDLKELKQFVKKLPNMQALVKSLETQIAIGSLITKTTSREAFREQWRIERAMVETSESGEVAAYIQQLIWKCEPVLNVLRLLCLRSATDGGLKPKEFDAIRREIVHSYGFDWLFTLNNLEKLGMLRASSGSRNPWPTIVKDLALIDDDVDVIHPKDIHYVTAGYAPLSVRLIQIAMARASGWAEHAAALKALPGPPPDEVDVADRVPAGGGGVEGAAGATGAAAGAGGEESAGGGAGGSRKTVLVFFIGGVTYLEIAAIRHLSEKMPFDFVIATTKIISGMSLIDSVVEVIENKLPARDLALTDESDAEGAGGAGGGFKGRSKGKGKEKGKRR